jgi:hypothetical protein
MRSYCTPDRMFSPARLPWIDPFSATCGVYVRVMIWMRAPGLMIFWNP